MYAYLSSYHYCHFYSLFSVGKETNKITFLIVFFFLPGYNKNPNFIDLSEPNVPGPFHDLTKHEIIKIREFITQDPNIRAVDPEKATVDSSYMFMMDLLTANKGDILKYLDKKGPAPDRHVS